MPAHHALRSMLVATLTLGTAASAQTLAASKLTYALGEAVTVSFRGVTTDRGSPYVVLVPAGARDDQDGSLHSAYLAVHPDGSVSFRGVKAGQYEARLYYASAVTGVVARSGFQVTGPAAKGAGVTGAAPTAARKAAAPRAGPRLAALLGNWQCMTRMQAAGELMFTFELKRGGVWEDLTFRPKRLPSARYSLNTVSGILRLYSARGEKLHDFEYIPAASGSKARLVEQVQQADLYSAQVCYRFKP